MKKYVVFLILFLCVNQLVFATDLTTDFLKKIKKEKPSTIELFVNFYSPIPDPTVIDKYFESLDSQLRVSRLKCLNELAYISIIIRRSSSVKSLRLLKELKNKIQREDDYIKGIYNQVYARLLYEVKKKDLAIKHSSIAISYLEKCKAYGDLKMSYINHGFFNLSKNLKGPNELKIAKKWYDKALRLEEKGVLKGQVVLQTSYAYSALMMNDPSLALKYCNKALEKLKNEKIYDFMDEYRVLIILASIHFHNKNIKLSNIYLNKAREITVKYRMLELNKEINFSQSERAFMKGDYKNAYMLLHESDSLTKVIALDKIREGIAVYDLEHKIAEEKKEKSRIQKVVAIQAKQKNTLLIFLIIFSVALIGITLLLLKIRSKNKVLVQQNLKLANVEVKRAKIESTDSVEKDVSLELILELEKLIYDKKLYEKSNLTIDKIAKKLNTNRTYLSEAINTHYKENYSSWINEIRINASLKLLASPEYDQYSIEGIANMVGYSAISSFNASFKKITGLTPTQFKKTR